MSRNRLPQRRSRDVFDLKHGGLAYAVTVGRYPGGAIGEVFISTGKAGTDVAHLARDAAILMSLALQHGAGIDTLAEALTRSEDGTAAGLAGAVVDEIARREALPSARREPDETIRVMTESEGLARIGFLAGPRLSGDVCATCGAAAMVRTGTCLTCQSCGSSSGGCA